MGTLVLHDQNYVRVYLNENEIPTLLPAHLFDVLDILADDFVKVAKSKGFYSSSDHDLDKDIAATHEEVSELRQAISKGKFNEFCDKFQDMVDKTGVGLTCGEEEIADVIIQALKLARLTGIKNIGEVVRLKHKYNWTRPFLHGRKE